MSLHTKQKIANRPREMSAIHVPPGAVLYTSSGNSNISSIISLTIQDILGGATEGSVHTRRAQKDDRYYGKDWISDMICHLSKISFVVFRARNTRCIMLSNGLKGDRVSVLLDVGYGCLRHKPFYVREKKRVGQRGNVSIRT